MERMSDLEPTEEPAPRRPRGPLIGYLVIGGMCAAGLVAIWLGVRPPSSVTTSDRVPLTFAPIDKRSPSLAPALLVEDRVVGTGKIARSGDTILTHYTLRVEGSDDVVDTSRGHDPFEVKLGAGVVIKGWDLGLEGMRVGGTRHLVVPYHLGYGELGARGKIPPKAQLIFDVELVDVVSGGDAGAHTDAHEVYSLDEATRDLPGNGRLVATLVTSKGIVTCNLLDSKAPNTVASFIGLATGKRALKDSRTGEWTQRPAYDGTIFHRTISGFMIQGGDPNGDGTGEPGFALKDEIWEGARHDRAGLLCMANRGKDTNGMQFFITDGAAPHLDDSYTIFGSCDPVTTVHDIASAEVTGDRPKNPVTIESVRISRVR